MAWLEQVPLSESIVIQFNDAYMRQPISPSWRLHPTIKCGEKLYCYGDRDAYTPTTADSGQFQPVGSGPTKDGFTIFCKIPIGPSRHITQRQRRYYVKRASFWRNYVKMTSFWRHNDVIITSCVQWGIAELSRRTSYRKISQALKSQDSGLDFTSCSENWQTLWQ